MADKNYANWTKNSDGTLKLVTSIGGQCTVTDEGVIAIRIEYLEPGEPLDRISQFQFEISVNHAQYVASDLLEKCRLALDHQASRSPKN